MPAQAFGRYEIKEELGRGGMAVVYHASDPRFRRDVAIKVLPREFLFDTTFRARFEREAQTIAALGHPAIVPVHDFGEHEGQPYLVMAYMGGGSLADRIRQGPLALAEAARIVERVASALDAAHSQGIIHRDIKPSNILFDQWGEPHVGDFGIVKVTESTAQLTGSGLVGTPAYMAPEMIQEHSTTPLVDVYALGVALFEMLTGQQPYRADTPMGTALAHVTRPIPNVCALRPDLPDAAQAVIERAMAKDPTHRYQSAGEMADDLRAVVSGAFVGTHHAPSLQQPTESAPPYAPTVDVIEPPARMLARAEKMPPTPRPAPRRRGMPSWVWIGGAVVVIGVIVSGVALGGMLRGLTGRANGGSPAPGLAEATETATQRTTNTARPTELPTGMPMPADTPMPTGTPIPLGFPGNPVTSNNQWTPVMQEFDGVEMVLVPAGCFMMGNNEGNSDEQPVHRVCFEEPFWIDRTEVTNGQYGSSGEFSGGNRPRESIDWWEAQAFCESRGARLPTEAEWEYAARGPDGSVYPWGNDFVADNVVYADNSGGQTWEVGSKPGGMSWVGAYDLSGNVWEWVNDWYSDTYYSTLADGEVNPQGPGRGECRGLRGGSWGDHRAYLLFAANREWSYPSSWEYLKGFRCARSY